MIQVDLLPHCESEQPQRDGLHPTRALLRHRSGARVLGQVSAVRLLFPELDGIEIRVGLTRAARGYASVETPTIWMNPYRLTRLTIAHELVHLLQNQGLIPGGEKTADLHALARHISLVDDLPHYLKIPADLERQWRSGRTSLRRFIHQTAREALATGNDRPRRVIRLFEETLRSRWDEARDELLRETRRASQMALFPGARPAS